MSSTVKQVGVERLLTFARLVPVAQHWRSGPGQCTSRTLQHHPPYAGGAVQPGRAVHVQEMPYQPDLACPIRRPIQSQRLQLQLLQQNGKG